MLARHRGTISRDENKYSGSVFSRGADSGMKDGPLSADGSVKSIASTSKAASKVWKILHPYSQLE